MESRATSGLPRVDKSIRIAPPDLNAHPCCETASTHQYARSDRRCGNPLTPPSAPFAGVSYFV